MLATLWCHVLSQRPSGRLDGYDCEDIAAVLGWEGDPRELVDALYGCGFLDDLDGVLAVHDWDEYAGGLLAKQAERREKERLRKRRARAAQKERRAAQSDPQDFLEASSLDDEEPVAAKKTDEDWVEEDPVAPPPSAPSPPKASFDEKALQGDPSSAPAPSVAENPKESPIPSLTFGPRGEIIRLDPTEPPEATLEGVEQGVFDGFEPAKLAYHRSLHEVLWRAFAERMGVPEAALTSTRRSVVQQALREGHAPSSLLLAAIGATEDDWCRGRASPNSYHGSCPPSLDSVWKAACRHVEKYTQVCCKNAAQKEKEDRKKSEDPLRYDHPSEMPNYDPEAAARGLALIRELAAKKLAGSGAVRSKKDDADNQEKNGKRPEIDDLPF